jgi:hypothetical protein
LPLEKCLTIFLPVVFYNTNTIFQTGIFQTTADIFQTKILGKKIPHQPEGWQGGMIIAL